MIGYHYTSYENWRKIRELGLIPYRIPKEKLQGYFKDDKFGIWIWQRAQKGFEHTGSIIFQSATKESTKIVLLRVEYNDDKTLMWGKQKVLLHHEGTLNSLPYHNGTQTARIVVKRIPPSDITLLEVYDLTTTFKEHE